jgi:hypothetical protein
VGQFEQNNRGCKAVALQGGSKTMARLELEALDVHVLGWIHCGKAEDKAGLITFCETVLLTKPHALSDARCKYLLIVQHLEPKQLGASAPAPQDAAM